MTATFATSVFRAAYWLLVGVIVYLLFVFIVPEMDNPDAAAFLPIFAGFLVILLVGALIATRARPSPRRRWLWIALLVPPVLVLLANAPYIPYSLTHPVDPGFIPAVVLLLGTGVLLAAGVAVYRESGAAGPGDRWGPRARVAVAAIAGLTAGAVATGYVASGAAGGSASIAASPTIAATLVTEETTFATTSYSIGSGDVLGLFVENRDGFAHSFDIDALNVHVQLPAGATVALSVSPSAPGTLEFYCAVPGHREAGMVGTIVVG